MSDLQFQQVACRSDNYVVMIIDHKAHAIGIVDAPDAAVISDALKPWADQGYKLTHIFVTHHHGDHTEGIAPLKAQWGAHVVGPMAEAAKIAGLDQLVSGGDTIDFHSHSLHVMDLPGHTLGHIGFHIAEAKTAFVGDTLFAMGCGRLLEGTPAMMWASLLKIAALPVATQIYCGHEYTLANVRFALTVDPKNQALQARSVEVKRLRDGGVPTIPTRLEAELATNPFLRAGDAEIAAHLGLSGKTSVYVFAELRARKDRF